MRPGLEAVLRELHAGEVDLEQELHVVAERHRADHEVRHVAVDLARWSLQNRQALEPVLARFGEEADTDTHPGPTLVRAVREKSAELLGRREETGLLLLRDLRQLHLMAEANSVLWTMVGQAALGTHDEELLETVTACHERTTRQGVWANAMVKTLSTQLLSAV